MNGDCLVEWRIRHISAPAVKMSELEVSKQQKRIQASCEKEGRKEGENREANVVASRLWVPIFGQSHFKKCDRFPGRWHFLRPAISHAPRPVQKPNEILRIKTINFCPPLAG